MRFGLCGKTFGEILIDDRLGVSLGSALPMTNREIVTTGIIFGLENRMYVHLQKGGYQWIQRKKEYLLGFAKRQILQHSNLKISMASGTPASAAFL